SRPSRGRAVANDAGVQISTTRAREWMHVQLPIAQIYHATVDTRIPYYVYGNKQDGPSYRGPSNSRSGGQIGRSEWHSVEGGESGWATPDPVDTNLIWSVTVALCRDEHDVRIRRIDHDAADAAGGVES